MALAELIFGERTRAKVGVVQFDCSVSEQHTDEAEISEHPIEDGGVISDHIVDLPSGLVLNGLVTNTPIVWLASLNAKSPIEGDSSNPKDRVQTAYDELRRVKREGERVTVVTSLRVYPNMAIKNISVVRNTQTGNILDSTITLRQLDIVKTLSADLPEPLNSGNAEKSDKGRLGKKDASDATEGSENVSALKQGADFVGNLLGL
jgi:hypothetical protein